MKTRKVLASPIKTDRLNLRKFQTGDENSLFTEYFGDWEASKYLQRMPHKNICQTKNMLENWCGVNWEDPDKNFAWIVSDQKTDLALGIVLFFNKENCGEIHFGLGKKFQGQGFMQESLKAVLTYLKDNSTLERIETFCDAEHTRSKNVLIKSGFTQTGILKNWARFPLMGEDTRDCLHYYIEIN